MSGNVWKRLLGSSMVDMGILSNNMKMLHAILDHDHMQWHPPFIRLRHHTNLTDHVTELDLISDFDLVFKFRQVSIKHLQRVRLANRGHLLLWIPGPVPLAVILMLRPVSPELVMFPEFWTSRRTLFCFKARNTWRISKGLVLTIEHMQVSKGTRPGVRMS